MKKRFYMLALFAALALAPLYTLSSCNNRSESEKTSVPTTLVGRTVQGANANNTTLTFNFVDNSNVSGYGLIEGVEVKYIGTYKWQPGQHNMAHTAELVVYDTSRNMQLKFRILLNSESGRLYPELISYYNPYTQVYTPILNKSDCSIL